MSGFDRLFSEAEALYENIKISNEKRKRIIKENRIVKNILIQQSIYDRSRSNPKEKDIVKNLPIDINIYSFSLKDSIFNTSQSIKECAMEDNFIFNIKMIENKRYEQS